jgi:mRNA interferase MazF
MHRGEIWWAALGKPMGNRPVVLVSRETAIQVRQSITIAMVTSHIRDIPVEVPLGPEDGLPKKCVVNCDVLSTIPKSLLQRRIGRMSPEKEAELNEALEFALDLSFHY